jgi:hypothetical protein
MRPTFFDPSVLRQHLRRNKIADLPELKRVLGTDTGLTVFRKLKQLHYLASYTHRGRFYTLPEIAHFDDRGLWSHEGVWFSRHGTLLATLETFVNQSANGYYAHELADALHAEVLPRSLTVAELPSRQLNPSKNATGYLDRSSAGFSRWSSSCKNWTSCPKLSSSSDSTTQWIRRFFPACPVARNFCVLTVSLPVSRRVPDFLSCPPRLSRRSSIISQGMIFLTAALWLGRFGLADRASRFALAIFGFGMPDASPSHSTMGGQLMWL